MAYSENLLRLAVVLCKSLSAEKVSTFLSEQISQGDKGYQSLTEIAQSAYVPFNRADWEYLLQGAPDPKTIRDWCQKTSGTKGAFEAEDDVRTTSDKELGPHQRTLFYFGQRLRNRMTLETPADVAPIKADKTIGPIWSGTPTGDYHPTPHDAEEEQVERDWGVEGVDARMNPLFPLFKQHLKERHCWSLLTQVAVAAGAYHQAYKAAYQAVSRKVKEGLPDNADADDINRLALSLLCDGFNRAKGVPVSDFGYRPERTPDGKGWTLRLDQYFTVGNRESPEELELIGDVHRGLTQDVYKWKAILKLATTNEPLLKAMEAFRNSLSPDDRLRKFIIAGRCDLCR